MKNLSVPTILLTTFLLAPHAAHASFMTFFGEETVVPLNDAGNTGRADPTDPLAAYDAMVATLGPGADLGIEDFEHKGRTGFDGVSPTGKPASVISLDLGIGPLPITATLTGIGQVAEITTANGNSAGRYPVTVPVGGTQYFDTNFQQLAFNIEFSSSISAFGFFATDVGDFNGQIELLVTDANDVQTTLVIPHSKVPVSTIANEVNASLFFFGFTSDVGTREIGVNNTAGVLDRFGFDNLVVVTSPDETTELPEPASAMLLLTGTGCFFLCRRVRRPSPTELG